MSTDKIMSAQSTEFVPVLIEYTVAGLPADPVGAGYAGSLAFPVVDGVPTTWFAAEWEQANGQAWLVVLVGPDTGQVVLDIGTYDVWWSLDGGTEHPVAKAAGRLIITQP